MEEEEESLYLQLDKLPDLISEEIVEDVLQTLWKTRRIGLKPQDKTSIQSLLLLPSPQQLDPVLACLRLLIRKSVHENLIGDDFLKLFPPGLSPDLQNVLLQSLQKYQRQWKEEASRDQTTWQRPSNSHVKYGVPPSSIPSEATEIASSMWTRQHDSSSHFSHDDIRGSTPVAADTSVPLVAPLLFQRVDGPDNLLHDYTKSPSGEREVKFQLNRDTLEAMLTSMTYISNQLTNVGGPSAGPLQKRPRV
ncbi:hypothetical protein AQUCO_01400923v1 [Aquilegia coerulea]|uniref:COMM domain-containing protein n=1 Tax=Aquilegia coerulea TaxID=218851 RepID=A0A2G5DZH4_AQUCA|nr:hypothetical protein AQUCO_01400923v1 [Aquilegia coerulea]